MIVMAVIGGIVGYLIGGIAPLNIGTLVNCDVDLDGIRDEIRSKNVEIDKLKVMIADLGVKLLKIQEKLTLAQGAFKICQGKLAIAQGMAPPVERPEGPDIEGPNIEGPPTPPSSPF